MDMGRNGLSSLPWYRAVGQETLLFEHCYQEHLPLMLKGPTGTGKSRFVEYMAAKLGRPLTTVACHDDTTATDLLGRYLIRGGDTVWQDGPVTRAMRSGSILYLDEVVEARSDVLTVIHPLTDHRRELYLERHNEVLSAPPEFMVVVSFNPFYQQGLKELKPSTRQRFVGLTFHYPVEEVEIEILIGETAIDTKTAKKLVQLAGKLRVMDELGLAEIPSTRVLVDAAKLILSGLPARYACQTAIVEPLSDDDEVIEAMSDVISLVF